ncbi:MAG: hypothetical protein HFH68_12400 [Lachnospiraceae bacterium]|nr:hypothetical protein [Lachnospiraceae bacterium]
MENNTYNPNKLIDNYLRMEHGKARTDAMRYAVEQADLNNDLYYMLYFRMKLCDETEWYGNGLDNFTAFPELLAIMDKNTVHSQIPDSKFYDIMEDILWTYESLLSVCAEYYQVPFDDCVNFHIDFKKRWAAYGRSPREPYRMLCGFYIDAGYPDKAGEALSMLEASPMESYDCPGCIANTTLRYYLLTGKKEKAESLAAKIEDGTLKCGNNLGNSNSIPRMHKCYLNYYLLNGMYEKAAEKAYILEHYKSDVIDYKLWASFMCAYVYTNTGRGLRIYKKHWKDIENEKRPGYMYCSFKDAACFFTGLKKVNGKDTVKLKMDNTFPLYNDENIYNTDSLASYYYKKAEDVAKKFDQRNGTSKHMDELEISVKNMLAYSTE